MKIELFTDDLILGDFRVSSYGLMVGSFSYNGESEDDTGINLSTIEEYVGHNPVPVYLGQKYSDKINLQITLIKNPCIFCDDLYFSEKDCRGILRLLTGAKGYQWLKLITPEPDEDLWYRARTNSVSYKRIDGHIAGLILNLECDSCFAWSKEYEITVQAEADQHFYIYNNTDDLNNYVYPAVDIFPASAGTVSVTNLSDNGWLSEIKNIRQNEKIKIDSKRQIISSSLPHDKLLNDFNLGWFRLAPGQNEYVSNTNITISLKFRVPRKVGIIG